MDRHDDITILTEDWFYGYTPREDRLVPDVSSDVDLDADELDEYAFVPEDEKRLDDDLLSYLHRDEPDSQILARWDRPDDELDEIASIEDADERMLWRERMTAFHERSLHRRLTEYFGTTDYRAREIVLKWKQDDTGRWLPEEKLPVLDWIAAKVEEKGDRLSGIASCNATIRAKLARRRASREGSANWWRVYNES